MAGTSSSTVNGQRATLDALSGPSRSLLHRAASPSSPPSGVSIASRSQLPIRKRTRSPIRLEQVEAFGGIRPDDQIAAADDRVGLGAARIREHGLECRQVSVDVVERGDPHAGDATPLR